MENTFGAEYLVEVEAGATFGGKAKTIILCIDDGQGGEYCYERPYPY